ncbi:hypothetical protein PAMA_016288 [Pampus argenteus]
MAPPAEDYYCRWFQPNTFDSSRCSACLRPDHMHLSSSTSSPVAAQQNGSQERLDKWREGRELLKVLTAEGEGIITATTSASSSNDDLSSGWTYKWSLVHTLSPDWELNICDTDIQSSSPNQWDCPERRRSLSAERHQTDMTRLDPSPQRGTESSWMDERRGRDRSRRASESRKDRERESGYFSPDRRADGENQTDDVNKRSYRYYERGHPLPSNYVPEPKATVPYRNVNLGVPSQRRNLETYMLETWRSESPQRYTYHSNFRRGTDSERNSPTRHSSVSPDRYKLTESPVRHQRRSSVSRSQTRTHVSSHGSAHLPSHCPSRHTSGRSSPSRRRGSIGSGAASPSRVTHSHKCTDSLHLLNSEYGTQKGRSRESRSPSQASNKHSLDSEKLYRNLESISRRASSAIQQNSYKGSQVSPQTRTTVNSSVNTRSRNSREVSPSRNGYGTHSHTSRREPCSRDSKLSRSQGSWQGSSHSILSLPPSRGSSTSRRGADSQAFAGSHVSHVAIAETDKGNEENVQVGDRSRSNIRRGMEALLISESKKAAVEVDESSDNQSGKHRSSKVKEQAPHEYPQTQWRKHWFVLSDASLRYYRDSEAEESDDLDGAINLTSCVNVSDCEVEKNYGLQIQTKRAVFTLSAMTSRIRRNWVKLLKQAIQNNMHQSVTVSEKENPLSRRPSSCQPPGLTCEDSGFEPLSSSTTAANSHQAYHQHQAADGDLDTDVSPATQREEGEGWDREQAKRLEERNKWFEEGVPFGEMGSRWDCMELKKGSLSVPVIKTMDSEVNRKWTEFERLSFRDMSVQSLIGVQTCESSTPQASQTYQSSPRETEQSVTRSQTDTSSSKGVPPSLNGAQTIHTNKAEAPQKEVLSLRKQVESTKREYAAMDIDVGSPCGPGAPCRARLEAMEVAHRKALQELQDKHAQEIRELEGERDKVLREESQAAAKAIEALRASHREELEREVEKARWLGGGAAHVDSLYRGHMPQADDLHSELDVLSERYSQKCLELSRTEQSSKSRETELGCKERELEQLRRENQELKAKLAEEISRMRYFITGQRSDMVSPGSAERTASEVEILLRAKENEVQYLKKEISCLQSEVQSLTKEKEKAYERYKEAYVELSDMKGRSQLEKSSLNEHLRLANAALQEEARKT